MEGKVGPYNEGATLVLTCDILGGNNYKTIISNLFRFKNSTIFQKSKIKICLLSNRSESNSYERSHYVIEFDEVDLIHINKTKIEV